MASPRPLRLPAADFDKIPLPVNTLKGLDSLRVHGSSYPPVQFRQVSSHRFTHPDAPQGLLYLGFDLETCLWECFGDAILNPGSAISRARWMNQRLSRIRSSAALRLCDLTDFGTRAALRVDLSALSHPELDIPQAWGLAIQKHPEEVDGLLYQSRFTGKSCMALFGRPGILRKLRAAPEGDLSELESANLFLDKNRIALV